MEESDLLKERVQAITERHHIQELIRVKKLELDQEKLKLQHLKKKNLRENWLLQDSVSHNALDSRKQQSLLSDQQQTRTLQLNIHSIEMDILSLEREESRISINESLILNRLRAVEKSPEEIIREAQATFVPEPLRVFTLSPESLSPAVDTYSEPNTARKTLFAMEINVNKNLLTGKSTVLSTSAVSLDDFNEDTGHKVFDDGRKCVYASSQQGSNDMSCIAKLTASEVEQLLKSATVHRQIHHPNSGSVRHFERDSEERCDFSSQREQDDIYSLGKNKAEKWQIQQPPQYEHPWDKQKNGSSGQEVSNNHNIQRGGYRNGTYEGGRFYCGNQIDNHCSTASHQEVVKAHNPQFGGLTNVRKGKCCYYSPHIQTENSQSQSTALCFGPTACGRLPAPLYCDETPYTIINTLDTTEPITAIFMGFQAAEDESGHSQDFVGSLKAELVIIEDNEENNRDNAEKRNQSTRSGVDRYSAEGAASENVGHVKRLGHGQTENPTAQGTGEE